MASKPSSDDDFESLLDAYLAQTSEPSPEMAGVVIEWIEGDERVGALHIERKHGVSQREVEEVLLEVPPFVEARRHPRERHRTLFWGATAKGRWLFVVCEDRKRKGKRVLTPLTAFEPDDGEKYWRNQ